jgi:hypothetical protein
MTTKAKVSAAMRDDLETHRGAATTDQGVEDALEHHVPSDAIVPRRVVLANESGKALVKRLKQSARPTDALRKLMSETR